MFYRVPRVSPGVATPILRLLPSLLSYSSTLLLTMTALNCFSLINIHASNIRMYTSCIHTYIIHTWMHAVRVQGLGFRTQGLGYIRAGCIHYLYILIWFSNNFTRLHLGKHERALLPGVRYLDICAHLRTFVFALHTFIFVLPGAQCSHISAPGSTISRPGEVIDARGSCGNAALAFAHRQSC